MFCDKKVGFIVSITILFLMTIVLLLAFWSKEPKEKVVKQMPSELNQKGTEKRRWEKTGLEGLSIERWFWIDIICPIQFWNSDLGPCVRPMGRDIILRFMKTNGTIVDEISGQTKKIIAAHMEAINGHIDAPPYQKIGRIPQLNTAEEQFRYALKLWLWIIRVRSAYGRRIFGPAKFKDEIEACRKSIQAFNFVITRFPKNRNFCAYSQLWIADTFERYLRNNSEAITEYNRVIKDYPDQKEACVSALLHIQVIYSRQRKVAETKKVSEILAEQYPEYEEWTKAKWIIQHFEQLEKFFKPSPRP